MRATKLLVLMSAALVSACAVPLDARPAVTEDFSTSTARAAVSATPEGAVGGFLAAWRTPGDNQSRYELLAPFASAMLADSVAQMRPATAPGSDATAERLTTAPRAAEFSVTTPDRPQLKLLVREESGSWRVVGVAGWDLKVSDW